MPLRAWVAAGLAAATLGLALLGRTAPEALAPRAFLEERRTALAGRAWGLEATRVERAPGSPASAFVLRQTRALFEHHVHTDRRTVFFSENWILWCLGHVHPPLLQTQDPRRIRAGGAGLCSQMAAALVDACVQAGVPARLIALEGHVVAEAETEQGWWVADPDYGVVLPWPVTEAGLPARAGNLESAYLQAGLAGEEARRVAGFFRSTEDNRRFPVGAALSPRLRAVERTAEVLIWLVPALLAGLALVWSGRGPGARRGARP